MTTKVIKKSDSSFVMSTAMPDNWSPASTVTISIYDTGDGTAIVDGAATSSRLDDTISVSASAGDFEITLTSGALAPVDSQEIAIGSDAQGWQRAIVSRYTAVTKTVEIVRSLSEPLDLGSLVKGLNLEYTLDASVSGFDDLSKVKVVWSPSGDGMPLTELWEIQTEQSNVQGLESEFRTAYKELYKTIESEEFEKFETRARQDLKLYFESRLRNFDKVVDSDLIVEPMLLQIAIKIGKLKLSDEEYNRLKTDLSETLSELNGLSIWTDTNEDNIETDDETQPAQNFILSRGY